MGTSVKEDTRHAEHGGTVSENANQVVEEEGTPSCWTGVEVEGNEVGRAALDGVVAALEDESVGDGTVVGPR